MNAISATELKAILAHEFGHFSQRSMNLHCGTYSKEGIAVLDQVLKEGKPNVLILFAVNN
ncbi:hypothetical protein D3C87_1403870 [compost metagenome]